MSFNVNRFQRRKSNLGRRFRVGVDEHARVAPTISNLGMNPARSRSGKKKNRLMEAHPTNCVNKRLFTLNSPDFDMQHTRTLQDFGGTSSNLFSNSDSQDQNYHDNSLLNITAGVKMISPEPKPPSTGKHQTTVTRPEKKREVIMSSLFGEIEVPQSPGPSLYNQLILQELADIEPPEDPEDKVRNLIRRLSLKDPESPKNSCSSKSASIKESVAPDSRQSAKFSPHLSSTCIDSTSPGSGSKLQSSAPISVDKKLSIIKEDLDTTDSFLAAEQTILEQNQTITNNSPVTNTVSEHKLVNNKPTEPVLRKISCSESDEELDCAFEEINTALRDMERTKENMKQAMEDVDQMVVRMSTLKSSIQRLINKREKRKNKENCVYKTSIKQCQNKWINSLKSDNPGLLKTPKVERNSNHVSFADYSRILTPHSLSTVLYEQVDDLFD